MTTKPKKNSLKVVPYAPYRATDYVLDEASDSHQRVVTFDGAMLLDYTAGTPGEQQRSGWGGHSGDLIDWRPNDPFQATMRVYKLERGRSAARIWAVDEKNNVMYPFFGDTFVETLKHVDSLKGEFSGTWIVVRKGSNYGIELYQQ
jgi:hypothetical protein